MHLDYIDDLPFEYLISDVNKDIKLSDKIKNEFNHYYINISNSNNKDINRWTQEAKRLKKLVESEILESGNQKSIYVTEYVQFIFGVSYLFFNKFHMTQKEVASILGMTTTKYSKLDIFPYRCYSAFTKLDDKKKRKSLIPNDIDSEGIRIAECINKKVQARYACCGFIGVSNDLDLFANIATTDTKYFVLTSPMYFENNDEENIKKANYALARYQFALGNWIFNDESKYVAAGKLKEKILELLQMEDLSVIPANMQDELIRNILLGKDDLKGYLQSPADYHEFCELREKYRTAFENMNIEKEKLEDEYANYLVEYYTDDYDLARHNEMKKKNESSKQLTADEIVEKHYKNYQRDFNRYEEQLIKQLNSPALLKNFGVSNKAYFDMLSEWVKSEVVFGNFDNTSDSDTEDNLTSHQYEELVKKGAMYWISEVFKNFDGNTDFYNKAVEYLGKYSPLFEYLDALNAPPLYKDKAYELRDKNIHIYMRDEKGNVFSEIDKWGIAPARENKRPLMVYIDADALTIDEEIIADMMNRKGVVVIVHDKYGVLNKCLDTLDEELKLYIKYDKEI